MSLPTSPTLIDLLTALHDNFQDSLAVLLWLSVSNPLLDGGVPATLWDQGERERVYGVVLALSEGVVV